MMIRTPTVPPNAVRRFARPILAACHAAFIVWLSAAPLAAQDTTRIVLIAGDKSHPAAMHEYLKTVRLLKVMLEEASNLGDVDAEIVFGGWPADERVFDGADAVFVTSDGQDGHLGRLVPFMHADRMATMRRLVDRGVGLFTFHFATFAPDSLGDEILRWTGGYFDWQNDRGEREWYSDITTVETDLTLPAPNHPVANGVHPFRLLDEYYYDMRLPADAAGWTPILAAPALPHSRPNGDVVAWAVERPDGGRGFGTTTGHFYAGWKHPDYRRLMLNALVWTAGRDVPQGGVDARFYTAAEVTQRLSGTAARGLLLTGEGAACELEAMAVAEHLRSSSHLAIDRATGIDMLYQYDLRDYALVVLNACGWADAQILTASVDALRRHLSDGGGLLVLGAAREMPRPEAGADEPYREAIRVAPVAGPATPQRIIPADTPAALTPGLVPFLAEMPAPPPAAADAGRGVLAAERGDGQRGAVAWTYGVAGKGRVFVSLLPAGHAGMAPVVSRAVQWAADGHAMWNGL